MPRRKIPLSLPLILHVSGDFPDPIAPFKTSVIRSLLELSSNAFRHDVISINRKSPAISQLIRPSYHISLAPPSFEIQPFDFGTALTYSAPARGLLHKSRLKLLGDWLIGYIASLPTKPDLLMAHKLTIEGIAVWYAAKKLNLPYILTIQGNTDRKILAVRPDLRYLFKNVYHEAKIVFTFTPTAKSSVEDMLGKRTRGIALLPCPTDLDVPIHPTLSEKDLISVFHLKNHRVKNLHGMVRAIEKCNVSSPKTSLAIIGGGSKNEMKACQAIAGQSAFIQFEGPLERDALRLRMNRSVALVQPSLSESFGLVFIEALFAGLPIIYPARTAIDGYFDGAEFALRVDPRSPDDIARAIRHAVENEVAMKAALGSWQKSDHAYSFTRESIAANFRSLLMTAFATRA